jgi:hypothetical protein
MDEDLKQSEQSRAKRRDRKAQARHRSGMRTGLLKSMIAAMRAQQKRDLERLKKEDRNG